MPHFSKPSPNLETHGPVIEVRLAVRSTVEQALRQNYQPVPQPVRVRALIDTGASITVIREGIADRLGIEPTGRKWITTALSSPDQRPVYPVRLLFSEAVYIDVSAASAPLPYHDLGCVIGRDILRHAVLTYIGFKDTFTLSF